MGTHTEGAFLPEMCTEMTLGTGIIDMAQEGGKCESYISNWAPVIQRHRVRLEGKDGTEKK